VIVERGSRHEGVIVKAEVRGQTEWYWVKDVDGKIESGYKTQHEDDDVVYSLDEAKEFGI